MSGKFKLKFYSKRWSKAALIGNGFMLSRSIEEGREQMELPVLWEIWTKDGIDVGGLRAVNDLSDELYSVIWMPESHEGDVYIDPHLQPFVLEETMDLVEC